MWAHLFMLITKKEKDIFILGEDLTQALNFTEQKEKKFGSSLHYNGSNSHFFVNG